MKKIPVDVGLLNTTIDYNELIKQQSGFYEEECDKNYQCQDESSLDVVIVKKNAVKVKSYNPGFTKNIRKPREHRGGRND